MQKIALVIVTAISAIAALSWPTEPQARSRSLSNASFAEVILYQNQDGHFYADAQINGQIIRFLVDTGANAVALTEQDARKAGIHFSPANYQVLGEGAASIVRGQHASLDNLQIGDIVATDVEAAVVENSTMSLLGLSFLDEVDEIVIQKRQMALRKQL